MLPLGGVEMRFGCNLRFIEPLIAFVYSSFKGPDIPMVLDHLLIILSAPPFLSLLLQVFIFLPPTNLEG